MLTLDEIRAVPLFASLAEPELDLIRRTAADIRVGAGEVVVHAGDTDRVLFAVLTGNIEVFRTYDGLDRTLGWRGPGQIFGEIPIAIGSPFYASYRASEPTRMLQIEARQYFAIAAVAPEVSAKVSELARERIGGMQDISAEQPKPLVTLFGDRWDPACADMRRFLSRNQISFDWITLDSPDLASLWQGPLPQKGDCPVLRLADGTILVRPGERQVARHLGLQTSPNHTEYDTVMIGGGPAGLAAAVYGASEGLRTLCIEREAPGGQAGTSSRIENYLGFPSGVSGDELASRALRQATRLGAEILVTRSVEGIDPSSLDIVLDGDEVIRARTIVLATGVRWRRLRIEGFDQLLGKGIYFGAARSEAGAVNGLDVFLIGAGNSAGQAAMHFANYARKVTLVVRGDSLEKSMSHYLIEQLRGKPNVSALLRSEVEAVHGDSHLTALDIRNNAGATVERHECGGLFVFIGADAETAWLPDAIARDRNGYVLTGDDVVKAGHWSNTRDPYLLETSVPGIFACGDVRSSKVKRVAAAVGEGSMTIAFVHQYLQHVASTAEAAERRS
jgi:thioredoxin reductase (NADPH)